VRIKLTSLCVQHAETCPQGSINARMNVFYFLDTLCDSCLLAKTLPTHERQDSGLFYVDYLSRDLAKIVDCVVPEGRLGLPNLMSTRQVCLSLLSPEHSSHYL
jgi:CTD kinase subunit gamma